MTVQPPPLSPRHGKKQDIIVSINSHLPLPGFVCVCVSVSVFVCVNKIPASKVQWPGTDENPLGESLLDVSPLQPPTTTPTPSDCRLFLLAVE